MTITEKVAYLKGLAEGLALDPESSKEAKLIASMIDILEDIVLSVSDLLKTPWLRMRSSSELWTISPKRGCRLRRRR